MLHIPRSIFSDLSWWLFRRKCTSVEVGPVFYHVYGHALIDGDASLATGLRGRFIAWHGRLPLLTNSKGRSVFLHSLSTLPSLHAWGFYGPSLKSFFLFGHIIRKHLCITALQRQDLRYFNPSEKEDRRQKETIIFEKSYRRRQRQVCSQQRRSSSHLVTLHTWSSSLQRLLLTGSLIPLSTTTLYAP
jgi:hypothetical protein